MKSIISYEFAKNHGECACTSISSFNCYNDQARQNAQNLIQILQSVIITCKNNLDFSNNNIRHYINVHNEVPIWVLCSHLKLTDLSRCYTCLLPKTKKAICSHLSKIYSKEITSGDLYNFFWILSNIRNLCAHNLRLYNYKTKYKISAKNQVIKLLLSIYGTNLNYNNIISVAIIIYNLTKPEQFNDFIKGFITELRNLIKLPPKFLLVLNSWQNFSIFDFIDILIKMQKNEF